MHMKRLLFSLVISTIAFSIYAQSWTSGSNILYSNPSTVNVGIGTTNPTERLQVTNGALKVGSSSSASDRAQNMIKIGDGSYVQIGEWEADDQLSFKASKYNFTNGNVGIGVASPQYKLDVNGKLYLHAYDNENGWARSFLNWECHKLVMGVRQGMHAHTILELMPGGSSEGELLSRFSMYYALNESQKEERIRFCTLENSYINTNANFGIGTTNPLYKLDVRGTIRANEILVNTVSGADFVFDKSYKLRSLNEVSEYIQQNQHLPEIPSAAEMQEKGVNMSELQIQLLQKVEELTLYIIQQEQRIKELENQIAK